MLVHFICAGNTYRSRLAEMYLRSLKLPGVEVMSSGHTAAKDADRDITFYAKQVAIDEGLEEFLKPSWDQLTQNRLDRADVTVCMNKAVHTECTHKFKLPLKTYVWDIGDVVYPSGNPDDWFVKTARHTYQQIKRHVDELVYFLTRPEPTKPIDVLSEDGQMTGRQANIEEVNSQGLWHGSVHVGLYTPTGQVLLQRRSDKIIFKPGQWDIGFGGSVDGGETPLMAAIREGQEELGLSFKAPMFELLFVEKQSHYLPHYAFHNRAFEYVYLAKIKGDENLSLQSSEVAEARLVSLDEARKLLSSNHKLAPQGFEEKLLKAIEERL